MECGSGVGDGGGDDGRVGGGVVSDGNVNPLTVSGNKTNHVNLELRDSGDVSNLANFERPSGGIPDDNTSDGGDSGSDYYSEDIEDVILEEGTGGVYPSGTAVVGSGRLDGNADPVKNNESVSKHDSSVNANDSEKKADEMHDSKVFNATSEAAANDALETPCDKISSEADVQAMTIPNNTSHIDSKNENQNEAELKDQRSSDRREPSSVNTFVQEPVVERDPVAVQEPAAVRESLAVHRRIVAGQESAAAKDPVTEQEPAAVQDLVLVHDSVAAQKPAALQEAAAPIQENVQEPVAAQESTVLEEPVAVQEPVPAGQEPAQEPVKLPETVAVREPIALQERITAQETVDVQEPLAAQQSVAMQERVAEQEPAPESRAFQAPVAVKKPVAKVQELIATQHSVALQDLQETDTIHEQVATEGTSAAQFVQDTRETVVDQGSSEAVPTTIVLRTSEPLNTTTEALAPNQTSDTTPASSADVATGEVPTSSPELKEVELEKTNEVIHVIPNDPEKNEVSGSLPNTISQQPDSKSPSAPQQANLKEENLGDNEQSKSIPKELNATMGPSKERLSNDDDVDMQIEAPAARIESTESDDIVDVDAMPEDGRFEQSLRLVVRLNQDASVENESFWCNMCGMYESEVTDDVLIQCLACHRCYHRSCRLEGLTENTQRTQKLLKKCVACYENDEKREHHPEQMSTIDILGDFSHPIERIVASRVIASPEDSDGGSGGSVREEFLLKFRDRGHIHDRWVSHALLKRLNKVKLISTFRRKWQSSIVKSENESRQPSEIPSEWVKAERIVARGDRSYLVKWRGLGYDEATWEDENLVRERFNEQLEAFEALENRRSRSKGRERPQNQPRIDSVSPRCFSTETEDDQNDRPELYPFQVKGINWLLSQWFVRKNVILADEMGLGKTVQLIGYISALYELGWRRPFLIIAPVSTIENWSLEFRSWSPHLNVVSYLGSATGRSIIHKHEFFNEPDFETRLEPPPKRRKSQGSHMNTENDSQQAAAGRQDSNESSDNDSKWARRTKKTDNGDESEESSSDDLEQNPAVEEFNDKMYSPKNEAVTKRRLPSLPSARRSSIKVDVVLTSYDQIITDEKENLLSELAPFQALITDEGHRLKSGTSSRIYNTLNRLKSWHRILLTGTPLQNNVQELFSLIGFLDPKFDSENEMAAMQKLTEEEAVKYLQDLVRPCMLLRTKRDVHDELPNLPPCKIVHVPVSMSKFQKECYAAILSKNYSVLREGKVRKGLTNVLMELRKCCCHPFLVSDIPPIANPEQEKELFLTSSTKLNLLALMLKVLAAKKHRVLLFTQFKFMLDIFEELVAGHGYAYERLDGDTPSTERQQRIERFNAENSDRFLFMLSTRAGGLGINLTGADTVIIYDSDLNPFMDLQALSRAHRIGQSSLVMVYRLVMKSSVEEKIVERAREKLKLGRVALRSMRGRRPHAPDDELELSEIIRHGSANILNDAEEHVKVESSELVYTESKVEEILDRSVDPPPAVEVVEDFVEELFLNMKHDDAAETQGKTNELDAETYSKSQQANGEFWDSLLKHRFEQSRAMEEEKYGRGKRRRSALIGGVETHTRNVKGSAVNRELSEAEENQSSDAASSGYLDSLPIVSDIPTGKVKKEKESKQSREAREKASLPIMKQVQCKAIYRAIQRYGIPDGSGAFLWKQVKDTLGMDMFNGDRVAQFCKDLVRALEAQMLHFEQHGKLIPGNESSSKFLQKIGLGYGPRLFKAVQRISYMILIREKLQVVARLKVPLSFEDGGVSSIEHEWRNADLGLDTFAVKWNRNKADLALLSAIDLDGWGHWRMILDKNMALLLPLNSIRVKEALRKQKSQIIQDRADAEEFFDGMSKVLESRAKKLVLALRVERHLKLESMKDSKGASSSAKAAKAKNKNVQSRELQRPRFVSPAKRLTLLDKITVSSEDEDGQQNTARKSAIEPVHMSDEDVLIPSKEVERFGLETTSDQPRPLAVPSASDDAMDCQEPHSGEALDINLRTSAGDNNEAQNNSLYVHEANASKLESSSAIDFSQSTPDAPNAESVYTEAHTPTPKKKRRRISLIALNASRGTVDTQIETQETHQS